MSEILSKYAQFVDALLLKTRETKIPWDFIPEHRQIQVWNDEILCIIEKSLNNNWEDLYSVSLLNKSGDVLESFTDETLSSATNDPAAYFRKLQSVYELGMRQAIGADRALDNFLAAVQNDRLV